jgi:hypothetical protein
VPVFEATEKTTEQSMLQLAGSDGNSGGGGSSGGSAFDSASWSGSDPTVTLAQGQMIGPGGNIVWERDFLISEGERFDRVPSHLRMDPEQVDDIVHEIDQAKFFPYGFNFYLWNKTVYDGLLKYCHEERASSQTEAPMVFGSELTLKI